jgi:ABC-type transport system involved in multi-copper enzyme maturation permease subunit
MTTVTVEGTGRGSAAPAWGPATLADVLRSEWTKLRSVRSTWVSLGVATALAVGLGALISAVASNHYPNASLSDRLSWDPTSVSLGGLTIGQLAIAILGILTVTSEYSTGMIRTTLAAVPNRSRLLTAKAAVFTATALVVGEIVSFAAFLIGQSLINGNAPSVSLSDPGVLRAVIGAGLYLAVIGLLGVALGAIIRATAGAIATIVAILFVLPGVLQALPDSWRHPVTKYWPTQAGSQLIAVHRSAHTLPAWSGFAVMCLFVAIVLVLAYYLLERRDA